MKTDRLVTGCPIHVLSGPDFLKVITGTCSCSPDEDLTLCTESLFCF